MRMLRDVFLNFFLAIKLDQKEMRYSSIFVKSQIISYFFQIRFGDQLKIESTKAQGQFLHCSGRSLGQSKFIVSTDWYMPPLLLSMNLTFCLALSWMFQQLNQLSRFIFITVLLQKMIQRMH